MGQFLGNLWHASDKHIKTFGRKYEILHLPFSLLIDLLHLLGVLSTTHNWDQSTTSLMQRYHEYFAGFITSRSCPLALIWLSTWTGIHIKLSSLPLFSSFLSAQYIITASMLQSRDWSKSSLTSKPKDIYLGNGEFMSCFHIGKATVHFVSLLLCSLSPLPCIYFFSLPYTLTRPYPFLPCRPEEHNMWDQTAGK